MTDMVVGTSICTHIYKIYVNIIPDNNPDEKFSHKKYVNRIS